MMIWIILWLYVWGMAVTWDSVEELTRDRTDLEYKGAVVFTLSVFWPVVAPAVALRVAYIAVNRK